MNGRRLILGDIHGRFKALVEVLSRAGFRDGEDILYSVGDFCDRGRDNVEVLEYLASLRNFRPVLGNHDAWLQDYLRTGYVLSENWYYRNGGCTTVASFNGVSDRERKRLSLWLDAIPYCRMEKGIIIVHGGPRERNLKALLRVRNYESESEARSIPDELWDRSYLRTAFLHEAWSVSEERKSGMSFTSYSISMSNSYSELGNETGDGRVYTLSGRRMLYTGHSIVGGRPFVSKAFRLTALDTGASSPDGVLTLMDADSGEYWQSDVIRNTEEEN